MFWLPSDIKGNFHESPGKKQQERKHSLVFVVGPLKEDNNKERKKKNAVGDGPSPNNVQTHSDAQNSPMLNN